MNVKLEHANLNVQNIDETVRFLQAAFPHFHERGRGGSHGYRWVHFGTDETYLCLNEPTTEETRARQKFRGGFVNHLGYEVDDAEKLAQRLRDAGFKEGYEAEYHPHRRRVYFNDGEGREWEFVQYFSHDPAEKNDYGK